MTVELDITQDLVDGSDGALSDGIVSVNSGAVQPGEDGGTVVKQTDGVINANTAPPAEKPASSLRDQLSSAFKGEPATEAAAAAAPAITQDAEGKWRTADGLFASKEQIDAFKAAQPPAAADTNTTQEQAPAFLSRMTPLEREQYNALPAETREFLGRTMEVVDGQASRFNEYGTLENDLIGPRREAWAANGMTPATALGQLFRLSDYATRDPKSFVLWFAEQNKIDLDAALDERDAAQSQDPVVRQMQSELQQLRQQLVTNQQGSVHQQQQAILSEVQAFGVEKDEAGVPKRPYLTEVSDTWPQHIQAIRNTNPQMPNAEVLQKAYDAACWANPTVRAKMQDAARAQVTNDAKVRAEAAKRAGSSVNGAANGGASLAPSQTNNNRSIREDLQAAFAEHAG